MCHSNSNQKKARVAVVVSDKVDFKTKKRYQRLKGTFYNDGHVNSSGEYNNYKHA